VCSEYADEWSYQCENQTGFKSCEDFVEKKLKEKPNMFENAYWLIKSLKVYTTPKSTPKDTKMSNIKSYLLVIFMSILIILVFVRSLLFWYKKIYRTRPDYPAVRMTELENKDNFVELTNNDLAELGVPVFSKNDFSRIEELGRGAFGSVYLYEVVSRQIIPQNRVAVKCIGRTINADRREVRLIQECRHNNIVRCFGCFEDDGNIMSVMEYLPGGDLHNHLINPNNILTVEQALNMSIQVADGMIHLVTLRLVHRDLAARNCILTTEDRSRTIIKITDFGLCRKLTLRDYYPQNSQNAHTLLPAKWTAIECLNGNGRFTEKSDVWCVDVGNVFAPTTSL
jgi:tRNA A-37 threonylcarbamoyl transferase component Bud32